MILLRFFRDFSAITLSSVSFGISLSISSMGGFPSIVSRVPHEISSEVPPMISSSKFREIVIQLHSGFQREFRSKYFVKNVRGFL